MRAVTDYEFVREQYLWW